MSYLCRDGQMAATMQVLQTLAELPCDANCTHPNNKLDLLSDVYNGTKIARKVALTITWYSKNIQY